MQCNSEVWANNKEEHVHRNINIKDNQMYGDMRNHGHGGAKSKTATSMGSKEAKEVEKDYKECSASTATSTVICREIALNHAVKKVTIKVRVIAAREKDTMGARDFIKVPGKTIILKVLTDRIKVLDRRARAKGRRMEDAGHAAGVTMPKTARMEAEKVKEALDHWTHGNILGMNKEIKVTRNLWHV